MSDHQDDGRGGQGDAVERFAQAAWRHTAAIMAAMRPDGSMDEAAWVAAVLAMGEAGHTTQVLTVWAQWLATGFTPDEDAFASLRGHGDGQIIREAEGLVLRGRGADSGPLLRRVLLVRRRLDDDGLWRLVAHMAWSVHTLLGEAGGMDRLVDVAAMLTLADPAATFAATLTELAADDPTPSPLPDHALMLERLAWVLAALGTPDGLRAGRAALTHLVGGRRSHWTLAMLLALAAHLRLDRDTGAWLVALDADTGVPVSVGPTPTDTPDSPPPAGAGQPARDAWLIGLALAVLRGLRRGYDVDRARSAMRTIGDLAADDLARLLWTLAGSVAQALPTTTTITDGDR